MQPVALARGQTAASRLTSAGASVSVRAGRCASARLSTRMRGRLRCAGAKRYGGYFLTGGLIRELQFQN
ncbi:MAG: hypothetical protein WCA00_03505, partial [Candidatus Acidiferrales bacterium]